MKFFFCFYFFWGHIFRSCVKIELNCVLVVGLKQQSSQYSVFKLRRFRFQNVSKIPYSRRLIFPHLNTRCYFSTPTV